MSLYKEKSVIASSGTQFFVFLLFFQTAAFSLKLRPKMRNMNLKVQSEKMKQNVSAKPRFYQSSTFQQVVCQSNHPGSCREQNCIILKVSAATVLLFWTPPPYFDFHR